MKGNEITGNGKTVMNTLRIGTVIIQVEYKRIKLLRMTVYPPDGRVCISAPLRTTDDEIRRFAESKLKWIEAHREKFRRNVKAANTLKNSEIHFVWGVAHNLEITEKPGRAKIVQQDSVLKMQVPPGTARAKKQELLDKWYSRLIRDTAPALVQKWEKITGIAVTQIFYRKMKTHWGSCNPQKHTIRLNTELAKKPPVCLEYVIVHEMLHVLESHHNRNFYRHMEKYFPNWKTIRRNMNSGEI
ncbi:MAG: M48 family metallopeptidase [Treponema sp.]|nr:M48 family metallopeptidase [Treponema sp.]